MKKELKDYEHIYSKHLNCDLIKPVYVSEESKPILKNIKALSNADAEELGYDTAESFLNDNKIYDDNIGLLRPNQFKYLIDEGFDIFGLIEAGIAIDATTIKEKI